MPDQFIRVAVKGRDNPSALYLPVTSQIVVDWLSFMAAVQAQVVPEPELFSMTYMRTEGIWVNGHWNRTTTMPHPMPVEDYWQLPYDHITVVQMMLTATINTVWWSGYCPDITLRVSTELLLKHQLEQLAKELE